MLGVVCGEVLGCDEILGVLYKFSMSREREGEGHSCHTVCRILWFIILTELQCA